MKKTALFSKTGSSLFFRKGFTLIELVIVISIIAILSTMAFFGFSKAQASARDASRSQSMNGVRSALERYYADNNSYPVTTWSAMQTALATYLTFPVPDPCPGGANVKQSDGKVYSLAATPVAVCTNVLYSYTSSKSDASSCATAGQCTSYSLQLTKESGGTTTWTNPQ